MNLYDAVLGPKKTMGEQLEPFSGFIIFMGAGRMGAIGQTRPASPLWVKQTQELTSSRFPGANLRKHRGILPLT